MDDQGKGRRRLGLIPDAGVGVVVPILLLAGGGGGGSKTAATTTSASSSPSASSAATTVPATGARGLTGAVSTVAGQFNAIFRFGADGGIELVIADQKGGSQTAGLPANATRATNVGGLVVDAQENLLYVESGVIHRIAGAGN